MQKHLGLSVLMACTTLSGTGEDRMLCCEHRYWVQCPGYRTMSLSFIPFYCALQTTDKEFAVKYSVNRYSTPASPNPKAIFPSLGCNANISLVAIISSAASVQRILYVNKYPSKLSEYCMWFYSDTLRMCNSINQHCCTSNSCYYLKWNNRRCTKPGYVRNLGFLTYHVKRGKPC